MDKRLICHKTKQTKQTNFPSVYLVLSIIGHTNVNIELWQAGKRLNIFRSTYRYQ